VKPRKSKARIAFDTSVSYTRFGLNNLGLDSIRVWRGFGFLRAWPVIAAGLSLVARPGIRAGDLGQSEPNGWIALRSMVVDGARISLPSSTNLRLVPRPHTVILEFGPALKSNREPARIRFKLDGYEERWREYPAEMRLCIRFLDGNGDQVNETEFKVAGQSEGWTGNLETTALTRRRETIVVPPRARSFWVALTSAGPPATVGVYALTDLVIKTASSNDDPATVSLARAFAAAAGSPTGEIVPAEWMRDGLRPSMARVFENRRTRGLAIVDDDLKGHAEWHTVKERAIPVTPGDRLVLEWNEAYSFGFAGPVAMQYLDLPSGYYRFRINELSVMGISSETESSVAFEVPLAFWRTPWPWVSVVALLLAAAVGGWRYAVWRRIHLQLQQLEQQRAVDRERLRIAQDIHDDLGARVTQISLLSAVAQRKPSLPDDARADFGTISQTTRDLISALYETVWAVNPENDNLDALATYLCQMSNQYCSQAQLRCRLEIPEMPPGIPLTSQVRHHLIMAVKEAIHNVIKHARATEVRLRIAFETSTLSISIHDDGCGFDPAACPPGHGLGNLQRRLQAIGGSFTIESRLGAGTTVALRLPVAEAAAGSA
jgi:signal transduction histidine kinase